MINYSGVIYELDTNTGSEDKANPYFINCCGYVKFKSKNISIRRKRVDYYLIYLLNGFGHYYFGDELITVPGGNIILFKADEEQNYFYLGHEHSELYWIHFTGYAVSQLLEILGLAQLNVFEVGVQPECIKLFDDIIHEIHVKNPQYHSFCISYLLKLLSTFSRESVLREKGSKSMKNKDIDEVIKKMQLEYQEYHLTSYYADICKLSVYQFIRKFKAAMQVSPSEYIEKIRMDRGRELLSDTDLTVSEISDIVGFNDPFYFSKVFKKNSGLSPINFRKQLKKTTLR